MTRIRLNADGTRDLLSWSHLGGGNADEALRADVARLEELNRQARAAWACLTPEERERRTQEFHQREAESERRMREMLGSGEQWNSEPT